MTPQEMAEKLREALKTRHVHFTFLKLDGTTRKAFGSLLVADMPGSRNPGASTSRNDNVIPFIDLEDNKRWKCCRVDKLVSIDD